MRERRDQKTAAQDQDGYGLRILNAIRQIIRAADLDSRQLAAHHQITAPPTRQFDGGGGERAHHGYRRITARPLGS